MVEFEGVIYGKPDSRASGVDLLHRMGGKEHTLATGFVLQKGKKKIEKTILSHVTIRAAGKGHIRKYVVRPQRFAGGYSVREKNDPVVEKVRGSYTNVVGLPMETITPILVRLLGE